MKGWIFDLVCPGNSKSVYHKRLLLVKNSTVNKNEDFGDVCNERHVTVAFNNEKKLFEVSNITDDLVRYPVQPYLKIENIAYEWEIQAEFFEFYNITPIWVNSNYTWGSVDYTTGQWSGGVGQVQRDEVDYAIWGYSGTYGRSTVAEFSAPTNFKPLHWLTRYPLQVAPTWNLFKLFTLG